MISLCGNLFFTGCRLLMLFDARSSIMCTLTMTTDYKEVYFSQYILYVQVSISVISSTSQQGATSLVAKKIKTRRHLWVNGPRFPFLDKFNGLFASFNSY